MFNASRFTNLIVFMLLGSALIAGCGSGQRSPVSTPVAPSPPANALWVPKKGDQRFQGLGAYTYSTILLDTGILGGGVISPGGSSSWGGFVGTPLELGAGVCGGNDCEWFFGVHGPNTFTTTAKFSNYDYAKYPEGISQSITAGHVITSLDNQIPQGVYATSEVIPGTDTLPFHGTFREVQDVQLSATVQQLTASGEVATAISVDGPGRWSLVSYSWEGDKTSKYETTVVSCELHDVISAFQNLASQGYFVTALGGNRASGMRLVGTRQVGAAQSRPSLVFYRTVPLGYDPFQRGYFSVGYILDDTPPITIYMLLEQ